jgi:hypothetical protein
MNILLDGMRERFEKAKARMASAKQAFQVAQTELQAAMEECNIWNSAINLEVREEDKRLAESQEKQISIDLPEFRTQPKAENATEAVCSSGASNAVASVNKTEKVREVLRAHGSGIAPSGLWTEVKEHMSSRAYLYSILKRLRDNDEVLMRRGKYLLKPKLVDVKAETEVTLLQ